MKKIILLAFTILMMVGCLSQNNAATYVEKGLAIEVTEENNPYKD